MTKPKAVALIGVCPYCGESAETILSKKQVKALMRKFKLSARNRAVGVKAKCIKCGKPIEILASKNEVKALWKGFQENSTTKAALTAEKLRRQTASQPF